MSSSWACSVLTLKLVQVGRALVEAQSGSLHGICFGLGFGSRFGVGMVKDWFKVPFLSHQETDNVGVVVFGDDRAIVEGSPMLLQQSSMNA